MRAPAADDERRRAGHVSGSAAPSAAPSSPGRNAHSSRSGAVAGTVGFEYCVPCLATQLDLTEKRDVAQTIIPQARWDDEINEIKRLQRV
jgi:hypothetical protein